jgi:cell division protein FtsL
MVVMSNSSNTREFAGGISNIDDKVDSWKQMVYAASRMSGYKTSAKELLDIAKDENVNLSDEQVKDILSANDPEAKNR